MSRGVAYPWCLRHFPLAFIAVIPPLPTPPPAVRSRLPALSRRRGFALLITITLLAFLVLLLVSLATLTRVETQVASNNAQLAQARANAMFALNLAMGQLQKYAGPDQAVTARADIDAANTGNPFWTGVWDAVARDDTDNPITPSTHAAAPKSNAPSVWLVNGNETDGTKIKPPTAVIADPATGNDNVWLVRKVLGQDLSSTEAYPQDGRVKLAKSYIEVPADQLAGLGSTSTTATKVGAYAWWVGDEGIKAKVNLGDPYRAAAATDAEAAWRRQAPPRPGLELLKDSVLKSTFTATTDAFEAKRASLLSCQQFPMLSTDLATPPGVEQAAHAFHDLTMVGYGVLADTLRGGLRRDLTRGLAATPSAGTVAETELGDGVTVFTLPTPGPFGRTTKSPTSAVWTPSKLSSGGTENGEPHAPTWSLVRSWLAVGNRATTAGSMDPVDAPLVDTKINGVTCPAPTGHAIVPVLVMLEMGYGLDVGSDGNYRVMLRPRVVLMNPYNVTLNEASYSLVYQPFVTSKSDVNFSFKHTTKIDPSSIDPVTGVGKLYSASAPFLLGDLINIGGSKSLAFNITDGFGPGEVKVYSLPATATSDTLIDGTDSVIELESGLTTNRAYFETGKAAPTWYLESERNLIKVEQSTVPADHPRLSLAVGKAGSGIVPLASNTARYIQTAASNSAKPHPSSFLDDDLSASTIDDNASTSRQLRTLRFILRHADMDLLTNGSGNMKNEGEIGSALAADTTSGARFLIDNNLRAIVSQRLGGRDDVAQYTVESLKGSGYSDIDYEIDGGNTLGFWGGSVDTLNGTMHAILFDVPRKGEELVSLGRLGQVNWGVDGKHPAYPLGNSFASVFYPAGEPDYGYALNESLWDRFFFSTLPTSLTTRPKNLPDSRLTFHDPDGAATSLAALEGDTGYELAATRLMVDGAFNINSTSVEAWAAFLGSVQAADYHYRSQSGGSRSDADVRAFPRMLNLHDPDPTGTGQSGNMYEWTGYRFLGSTQIRSLATEIVAGIKARGRPARSIAEFMNRDLSKPSTDIYNQMGIVQAAIDSVVNTDDPSSGGPGLGSLGGLNTAKVVPTSFSLGDNPDAARGKLRSAGAPGFLMQSDLLSPLAPAMSARSDTFRVRTYGEVRNPVTGDIGGRAWCEAVVQRMPEFVDQSDSSLTALGNATAPAATNLTNKTFGRKFVIVQFRWLSSDEI
jgi:hypothetical protein